MYNCSVINTSNHLTKTTFISGPINSVYTYTLNLYSFCLIKTNTPILTQSNDHSKVHLVMCIDCERYFGLNTVVGAYTMYVVDFLYKDGSVYIFISCINKLTSLSISNIESLFIQCILFGVQLSCDIYTPNACLMYSRMPFVWYHIMHFKITKYPHAE